MRLPPSRACGGGYQGMPVELNRTYGQETQEEQDKAAAQIEKLAEKAMGGNREALLSLCHAVAKSVLFRVMRRINNPNDAEDAAQEVLMRMCENIRSLRNSKAFRGWLNSIIINETNRYLAKNNKHSNVLNIDDYADEQLEANGQFLPDEYAVREDERREVMAIVDRLPNRQLEAVMLHYYEGMTLTQTARVMDVTKQSVARYLKLARDKIRKELQLRAQRTQALYGLVFLPIGPLLQKVSERAAGAAYEGGTGAWIDRAYHTVQRKAQLKRLAKKDKHWTLKTAAATLAVVAVLTGGVVFGVRQRLWADDSDAVGTVLFYGGSQEYSHLNPTRALIKTNSKYGKLTARGWKITEMDGITLLFSGDGGDAGGALLRMVSEGIEGEYLLVYALEDKLGGTYTLSRSFVIRSGY